jgi:hypothetical protein
MARLIQDRSAPDSIVAHWRPGSEFFSSLLEFFQGQPLKPEELERLRREIDSMDSIERIDDALRGIVMPQLAPSRAEAATGIAGIGTSGRDRN